MKKLKRFNNQKIIIKLKQSNIGYDNFVNPIWGREHGWRTAFEEVLKIIDENYKCGSRGVHALENVRRAIRDELGMTNDEDNQNTVSQCTHPNRDWEWIRKPHGHVLSCKSCKTILEYIDKDKDKCKHEYSTIATRIDMTKTNQCTKCGGTEEIKYSGDE